MPWISDKKHIVVKSLAPVDVFFGFFKLIDQIRVHCFIDQTVDTTNVNIKQTIVLMFLVFSVPVM